MDRNKLEQEALALLNKGNLEGAQKAFLNILRLDPKDRRVRQRVGELHLKLGRPVEAEKLLREVAEGLVRDGQGRAAVALFKQVMAFKGDDPSLHYDLADCYATSGYPNDARQHFDTAARLYAAIARNIDAARAMRRVVELVPGELVLKLKIAEYLEAGNDPVSAVATLREVIDDYRKRGRPDEVGRIAEAALRLAPDDAGLMVDAGAARLEAGDVAKAMMFLQGADVVQPDAPRTLSLLARANEESGDNAAAVQYLTRLAKVSSEKSDVATELDALRRAARLTPADPTLRNRLIGVERQMNRRERRVTQLQLAQATTEDELRTQVRAEVYARYGMFDRAIAVLRNAPSSLPLLATHAEVLVLSGDVDAAVRMIDAIAPKAARERDAVFDRIAVLRGLPEQEDAGDEETPVGAAIPAPIGPLETGDTLAAAGDIAGALRAYREALDAAPSSEVVLARIAALRNSARAAPATPAAPVTPPAPPAAQPAAPPAPAESEPMTEIEDEDEADPFAQLEDGMLSEISPDELVDPGLTDPLAEAESLVAVGMNDEALALLTGDHRLEARVIVARALRAKGDAVAALEALRDATNEAAESDPGYPEALFELSGLYTATGKHRSAVRLLEELADIAPTFRPKDVQARIAGLARLLK
jgi:tetratricopeptide (TPR) repeat protein